MNIGSYTPDLRDIEFVLFECLDLLRILGRGFYSQISEDDVKMILALGKEFAGEVLAPTNALADEAGCHLENGKVTVPEVFEPVWKVMREQGWISMAAPMEHGGQGLPRVVGTAIDEMTISANPAFHTYLGLTRSAANLLLRYGSEEIKAIFVPRLLSGEWQGTMCMTEAGAGSDVGASISRAQPADDGTYMISGTKMFITGGDHQLTSNHIHLVLARLPDAPAGVRGLSLFLVPKIRVDKSGQLTVPNDVFCSKVERKMGFHGSATTVLQFGENGQCQGYLVGSENQGIRCMFDMMNEERIVSGLGGQALAAAMYAHALKYARERIQGSDIAQGKSIKEVKVPIIEHPDVRRMLMTVRALAEGGRALLYTASFQLDLAAAEEDSAMRSHHEERLALLTPICKAWASDAGVEACSEALQVFGGSGYTSDFPAEQYLRDSRSATIYEGTNGIQAIDLLFRKALGSGGKLVESFHADFARWIQKHADHPLLARELTALHEAEKDLIHVTRFLGGRVRDDIRSAALGASPYLVLFGNVIVGWLLLDQAVLAAVKLKQFELPPEEAERRRFLLEHGDAGFYAAKIETARFFTHQILSQNLWRSAQITSGDRSALDVCF